ncbi:glycosyltransferase family 1 protein [bacterium]|nr:glycosyltransferase family 1 protein [bacterium]
MNVLIVADRFFPSDPGGLARVAWDAAKALARRGHTIAFVAAESGPGATPPATSTVEGVTVHRFVRPVYPAWHPQRASVPIKLYAQAVKRALVGSHFDAVHFHSIFTGMAVLQAIGGEAKRPRLVYTIHSPVAQEQHLTWSRQGLIGVFNSWIGMPIVRRMEQQLIAAADVVHVLSEFTTAQLRSEHPRLSKRYRVIPHFVYGDWRRILSREEARRRLGWQPATPSLFTVRQLRYRYGIEDAVAAVAPLAREGRCTLHIAGDGPDRDKLQSQIDSLGCRESVQLLGRISDDTLRLAYQAADLFLLPTRHLECFGLISLEAMSHGLPVLGTTVGAIPEVIAPILPDFLVPPQNPGELRQKLEAFLAGRLPPGSAGEISAYVYGKYGEGAIMNQYEQMYADGTCR